MYQHKMAEDFFVFDATLTFTPLATKYKYKSLEEAGMEVLEEGIKMQPYYSDPEGYFCVRDKQKEVVIARDFCQRTSYYIQDKVEHAWKLRKNEKRIGGYLCKQAEVKFRGRKYTAWYAPDIPIDAGPWKFFGLPGLILEVYDQDKAVHFQVAKINLSADIAPIITYFSEEEMVPFDTFQQCRLTEFHERAKRLQAKAEMMMANSSVEIEIESPSEPVFTEKIK